MTSTHESETVDIEVIRSSRKTLALQVRQDGTVLIRAPYRVSERKICAFVEEHRDWILRQKSLAEVSAKEKKQTVPLTEGELKFLSQAAKKDLSDRTAYYASIIGVKYGKITIRHQKTKWGSCSAKGNLNFNCLLMLAPEWVRDYVVVHELCHRKQMNHSPAFWEEVRRVFPDYSAARQWLRKNGSTLMYRNPIS